jgi:hypothetical protein
MTTALTTRVNTNATYAPTIKGAPISSSEIDNNFISLAVNKLETSLLSTANAASTIVYRDSAGAFQAGQVTLTGLTVSTTSILSGDVQVNNGNLTTTATSFALANTNATTVAAFGAATSITLGASTGTITFNNPTLTASATNFQVKSLGVGTAGSGTTGEIRATANITSNYSDERLKENINLIPDALAKVCSLRGVTFNSNALAESFGYTNKEKQVGVIAQDIEKVLPEAVKPAPFDTIFFEGTEISKTGQEYKTVQYERLVPLLIEAIKELNNKIEELKGVN